MTNKSAISFRTTYILIGLATSLLGVLAIYVFFADEKRANAEGYILETFKALKVQPGDVSGLEIESGNEKIVLSRQADGRWRITQPIEARADSDQVEAIVGELLTARNDDKGGADVTRNLGTHGLDTPAAKVTLSKGDRTAWIAFGKTTIGGDQAVVYVVSSDEPKTPHAVKKSRLKHLLKEKAADSGKTGLLVDVNDLRTRKLIGERIRLETASNEIEGIKLTEKTPKGERVLALSRKNPSNSWRFEEPPGYGDVETDLPPEKRNPKTIYDLRGLLNTILSIEVQDLKDFVAGTPDLASLGLDPTSNGVLRIDIERKDSVGNETLWIGKLNSKSELDKVFVRYGGDASVAEVNGEKPRMLQRLVEDPSTLRETTLLKLRRDRVDVVEITLNKKPFELRKIDGHWKIADGGRHDNANEEIERLLQHLTMVRDVRGFPPLNATDASLGLDDPAVEIKIWEDGLPPTEKSDTKSWPAITKAPTVRLQFGKRDLGDIVFVRRWLGDAKADFKMPAELLTMATRGKLDYLDIALSTFDPNKVQKITFLRDGEIWEMERDNGNLPAGDAEWRVLAPPAQKGKLGNAQQIGRILNSFKETTTLHVVSEKATADQLATLGLDPAKPVFKLELKFRDQASVRTYYLGNEVAGKLNVYAKTNLSDYVFEWPLAKKDMVIKDRILDPHLYRIEPGNVKSMKLRGWVDPAKPEEPTTIEFDRKPGGIWSTKGDFPFDAQKVEELFQAVLHPQSKEQVVDRTGPKPEHKLDLKDGALEIEIDTGEAKPVTLTLGGPAGKEGTTLFVMTNQSPGDVFTLDAERLWQVKEKKDALKAAAPTPEKK